MTANGSSPISVVSPFPRQELPALHYWLNKIRASVADDSVPVELDEWMQWQQKRMVARDVRTWGIFEGSECVGYFEACYLIPMNEDIADALKGAAQSQIIFRNSVTLNRTSALNAALQALFEGAETAFFPVFTRSRVMANLLTSVGACGVGLTVPRQQDGVDVETRLFAISRLEWEREHPEMARREKDIGEPDLSDQEAADALAL